MQGNQRRGRRPFFTTLVSERRFPGGREFIFTSDDSTPGQRIRSSRALQTARAFSWEDVQPANDLSADPDKTPPATEADYTQFLQGLRSVYRAKRRPG